MLSIFWMPFTGVKRLQKPLKPSNPEMEILPERFVQKTELFCVNTENFVRINNLLTFPFCYPPDVFIRQQKFITFRSLYRFRHFAQRREICPKVSKNENITFLHFAFVRMNKNSQAWKNSATFTAEQVPDTAAEKLPLKVQTF